jgi:hypothetical protein
MVAHGFLDFRECVLHVPTVAAALGDASLVLGHFEGLPEPVEAFAGQKERIRNKDLAAYAVRLGKARTREKGLRPRLCGSGYIAVSRCSYSRLFRRAFEWSGAIPTSHTRFGEVLGTKLGSRMTPNPAQTLRSPNRS